jgi:hypothetical protein
MTNTTRIAVLGLAALLLLNSAVQAGGLNNGSVNNVVDTDQAQDANDNLNDAVDTDQAQDIDDNLHDRILFSGNNQNINDIVLGRDGKLNVKMALAAGLLKLTCLVDDGALVIANTGSLALPAKTKLRWTVAALGEAGTLKLSTALAVGARTRTANLVAGADGENCAIKVLGR